MPRSPHQPAAQFKAVLAALITMSIPHVRPPSMPPAESELSKLMNEHSISRAKVESGGGGGGSGGGHKVPLLRVTTPEGSQHTPKFLPDDIFATVIWSAKFEGGVQGECGTWSGIPRYIGEDISEFGSEFPKDLGTDFRDEHPSWSEMHVDHLELYHQGTGNGYIFGEAFYSVNGAWNGTVEFRWHCGWQVDTPATPSLSEPEPELEADIGDEISDEPREILGIDGVRKEAEAQAGIATVD